MTEERLTFTVKETARLLGIGRQLAYDRVKTGEIPVLKIGRRLLVPRIALEKMLDSVGGSNDNRGRVCPDTRKESHDD